MGSEMCIRDRSRVRVLSISTVAVTLRNAVSAIRWMSRLKSMWDISTLASITLRSNGIFKVPQKPDVAVLGFMDIKQDPRAIVTNESFIARLSAAVDVST